MPRRRNHLHEVPPVPLPPRPQSQPVVTTRFRVGPDFWPKVKTYQKPESPFVGTDSFANVAGRALAFNMGLDEPASPSGALLALRYLLKVVLVFGAIILSGMWFAPVLEWIKR